MSPMSRRRVVVAGVVQCAVIAALVASGCGGSSSTTGGAGDPRGGRFTGAVADPPKPAPPLALSNYLGKPVKIEEYRGKAVFVTFIYVHCPDICPVIVSNMRAAQEELGPKAEDAQFIAVSVDPENDTPEAVGEFLKARQMTGRIQYLVGSRPQLEKVWENWNVVSRDDPSRANPDVVEHSAPIYGISASGRLTTVYPPNFNPNQIAHDAPLLASE
jgi:protein SCO1/2